jgi:hypothetical protein
LDIIEILDDFELIREHITKLKAEEVAFKKNSSSGIFKLKQTG